MAKVITAEEFRLKSVTEACNAEFKKCQMGSFQLLPPQGVITALLSLASLCDQMRVVSLARWGESIEARVVSIFWGYVVQTKLLPM